MKASSFNILIICLILSFHSYSSLNQSYSSNTIPENGLIVHLPLNNIHSTNSNLSELQGLIHGTTPSDNRKHNPNSAVYFNGKDDYIEIPNFGNRLNADIISISIWVKSLKSKAQFQLMLCPDKNRCAISIDYFHAGMNTVFWDYGWRGEGGDAPGRLYFRPEQIDKQWHHYVFISNIELQTMKIYKDNKLLISKNAPRRLKGFSQKNLKIGSGDNAYYYNGYLDDIRFYNRELTESEISILFFE